MKYNTYLAMFCTLFLFAIATAPVQAAEQGDEFRLNVYAMYCNQCAYGLEQELDRTGGVTDAIVDLQTTSAVVKVAGNDVGVISMGSSVSPSSVVNTVAASDPMPVTCTVPMLSCGNRASMERLSAARPTMVAAMQLGSRMAESRLHPAPGSAK